MWQTMIITGHIRVFNDKGDLLQMFGRLGVNRGELKGPYGVAMDSSGRVYISERGNHRVSVFTSGSRFLASFDNHRSGLGCFSYPRGLAVDANGVVYVCDTKNNCVRGYTINLPDL